MHGAKPLEVKIDSPIIELLQALVDTLRKNSAV
jgi:hypothetical protein